MAMMDPRVGRLVGNLDIYCACGYQVSWPAKFAVKKLGAYTRPAYVKLKCSACGGTTANGRVRINGKVRGE